MKTTLLTDLTVGDLCEGFVYNEYEGKGLFGWGRKLTIQPECQRNYICAEWVSRARPARPRPPDPLCAVGHEANAARIWRLPEMEAVHVRFFVLSAVFVAPPLPSPFP